MDRCTFVNIIELANALGMTAVPVQASPEHLQTHSRAVFDLMDGGGLGSTLHFTRVFLRFLIGRLAIVTGLAGISRERKCKTEEEHVNHLQRETGKYAHAHL
jgi:hypothetical protein